MPNTDICIPNIGPRERRRRLTIGLMLLAVTLLVAAGQLASGTPWIWRAPVFLPLWMATVTLMQVSAQTCVKLAGRGQRNMDTGDEAITDPEELQRVRAQARRVYWGATAVAALTTAAILLVPSRS